MIRKYKYDDAEVYAGEVTPASVEEIANWCHGMQVEEIDALDSSKKFVAINVPCMGGHQSHRASEGDFVIKVVNGEGHAVIDRATFYSYYTPA